METENTEDSWRKFQSGYLIEKKKKDTRQKKIRNGLICIGLASLGIGLIYFLFFSSPPRETAMMKSLSMPEPSGLTRKKQNDKLQDVQKNYLSKKQLTRIIAKTDIIRTDKNFFFIDTPEESYQVTTSIDIELQKYLLSLLARSKKLTRGKPQRIALVVMEAATGKIIAMTGFDLGNPNANPCTVSDYPAASIFKIVTAAAAVEELGYNIHTPLYFNGNKYTLYKRQLKEVKNKYTYKISFGRAFAESVNPVFGKIGKNYLGKKKLEAYADAFGFNQIIPADISFESGVFSAEGSEYHLAELGCGFNTDTTISPVFGAMLISTILNSGRVVLPRVVEHVTDSSGQIIYKTEKAAYKKAIAPETAKTMMQLMTKTISRGTARKAFRGSTKDKILSKLMIGGKTGSLYNRQHTVKYDWFVGFGKEKKTNRKIAISVVVGHRKYIGTRASAYGKMILKQYFKTQKTATANL
ncbi:MAG: PbpA [Desulfobacula sp.]|nr:PbpA [Desulfobacula sp.]